MSTATQSESTSPAWMRMALLRLVLVGQSIGCLWGFWYDNVHTDDFRLHYPLFSPWLWNLYLSFALASVVAMFAMWHWRKWGLALLTIMAVSTLFTEFYAMGFTLSCLRIPLALGLVWFLAQRVWPRFH